MESHPVDIDVDPEQVVRWLIVERQEGGSGLDIRASGINDTGAIEPPTEDRFGDEEREDLPSEDSEEEEPEPIDLETFYLEFVRPGRATITISAEAESTEAEAHLGQRIHAIETNVHVPEGWPEKKDNAALSSLQELT